MSQHNHDGPSPEKGKGISIEVMSGPEDGRVVVCENVPIIIGRGTGNEIHLSYDHRISRNHARIRKHEGRFLLSDLDSTNGTFIGKKRVREETPIEPDKLFRVGATLLRIKPEQAGAP